nr:reverse transcriptase domain-containing protein [Tanacetum cinerariifolium]
MLEKGGSAWAEEVPNVLWAHRTMKKTSNGKTPFSLTYGTEVVIPAKIGMPTHGTSSVNEKTNDSELRLNLDLLDKRREIATIREAKRNEVSRVSNTGKLGPTWEGPYKVIQAFQSRAYKLSNMEGEAIPRTWHACNLRRLAPEVTLDIIDAEQPLLIDSAAEGRVVTDVQKKDKQTKPKRTKPSTE